MNFAYVDSSLVLATLLRDQPQGSVRALWDRADRFLSSYLLQAEVFAAAVREGLPLPGVESQLKNLGFVRTGDLVHELKQVLAHGYLRGADALHLATALWIRERVGPIHFLTLDERQRQVAGLLGLPA